MENNFKQSLKVEGIDKKMKLMELKRKYDNGEISEKDMSHEEMEELTKLYKKETEAINEEIKRLKAQS